MKREYISTLILFIPLLVIQVTLIPLISIDYFAPDLILILIVYFTLTQGQLAGTIAGALFGVIFDLASGGLLGAAMFSKTLAAFVTGYFYSENKIDNNVRSLNFPLIVFVAAIVNSFFSGVLSGTEELNLIFLLFERSLLPAIYTSIVSVIIIFISPRRSFG